MKNKFTLTCILLAFTVVLQAQPANYISSNYTKAKGQLKPIYCAWLWNFDKPLLSLHSRGLAEIDIPYSVKNLSSGITTAKNVCFIMKNWYSPATSTAIDILGLEFGGGKQFFDLRMGLLYNFNPQITPTACTGFYEFIGYGRHYPFSFSRAQRTWENNNGNNYHANPGSSLWISPSVDFYFYLNTLSITQTIQNANSEVNLPGISASAQFTVPKSSSNNNNNSNAGKTAQATDLGLEFNNIAWGLAPRITIGNAPTKRFAWRLNFALLIPLSQDVRINVEQHGNLGNQNLGDIRLNDPVKLLYNGHEVHKFPFSFNGFTIGISVGFYQGKFQNVNKARQL